MKIDGIEENSYSLLNELFEGCQIIGFDWKYKYLNNAACKQARCNKKDLLGYSFVEKWPEITKTKLYKLIKDCLENRKTHITENKFEFPDGEIGWFELRIQPVRQGAFILSLDISEQKNNENELQENREIWKFATEGAGDGVWDWNAQTNEVFFSKQWKEMLGFSENEIGNTLEEWDKRVHPDDKEQVYADLNNHLEGKTKFYRNEHRVLCKDGSYKWILDRGKVFQWTNDNKPIRVIGTHTDVSEQKYTEKLLKESEERFAKIFNSSPIAISLSHLPEVSFVEVNDQWCKMTGYSRNEAIGKTVVDLKLKKEVKENSQILNKLREEKTKEIEGDFTTKSGKIIKTLSSIELIEIGTEKFVLFLTLDITDKKKAEIEINYQQELLHQMGKLAKVGGFEFIPKTGDGKWTDEVARIHDMDPSEYTSRDVGLSFYKGESKAKIEKAVKDISEKGIPYDLELELTTKKTKKWIHSMGYPVFENGKVVKVRGSVQDITDRKKAEEKLKNSETLNRNLVEHLPQKIFIKDKNSIYISCNDNYAKGLNLKPQDIIGKSDFELYPKEFAKEFQKDDKEVIKEGIIKDFEEKYFSQGKESFVHTVKIPYRNDKNNIIGVLGVFEDITDRKIAEENIIRNENLLRLFVEYSPAAIAMFDNAMRYIVASKRFNLDYGLGEQDLTGKSHYNIFPELSEEHKNIHKRCLAGETLTNEEDRLVRSNGKIDWVRWEIRPWYENDNTIGGIIFFSEVYTKQMIIQNQLNNERDRFMGVAKTVPGLICSLQLFPNGDIKMPFANSRTIGIYGFPPEKLAEDFNVIFNNIHPDDIEKVKQSISESAELIQPWKDEFRYNHPQKGEIWIEGHSMPQKEEDGSIIWHGYINDITERKKAEEKIIKFNEELENKILERTKDLNIKIAEIERMNRLFIGRELRMKELKSIIKEQEEKLNAISKTDNEK